MPAAISPPRRSCAQLRYTLLYVTTANASNATLYDKLIFNFVRDIAPIAPIVRFPHILVVNPSVPAKTLPEFIAYAKANPGKINMASPAIGSTPHLNGEPFKVMTGTNMVHVPYRSAAAVLTDLMSGQVQLYFGTTALSLEYVRTGKLRALGVTIERRLDALPESRPWLISCRATRRTTGKETEDPCQVQHPDGFGRNVHWTVWASLQTWSGSTLDGRATENINAVFKKDEISPWCWTINSQTRLFRRSLSLQRYKGSCVDFLFVEESDAHDQQIHRARQ